LTELVIAGGELHFQLVGHIPGVGDPLRDFTNDTFFLRAVDWSSQGDMALNGNDLHIFAVRGHVFGGDDFLANLRRGVQVGVAVALTERC
jgi:hypothetical protein